MDYYVNRYDPDTRQWLFSDFDAWFDNPEDSRAYVLLGDAAVGKSVMAAVIAQRAKNDGNLAAVYFCRHYDGTRRDPRYLLGTVAYQLCNCNTDYSRIVGGEAAIQNILDNSELGVHELFTKLLEEPLSRCPPSDRKLVVIDALDEAEYWSRDDFLDLIMNRFPLLPNWLLFFITSRPEDTVQSRLKTYNPCVRICAGNSDNIEFYQQHEQDIQRFLENRVNFSNLLCSPKEIAEKCNGMFLYAFYIVEILNNPTLNVELFPESINDYFRKNFKRIYDIVGRDYYKKLLGCVLMAPSPLPISFISFLLQREGCALDEQEVIDAVSQFVRTTHQTFTFLHSIIPAWLTDEQKASRRLVIERNVANFLFTDIIVAFLTQFLQDERGELRFGKPDLVEYFLDVGFRFLCTRCESSNDLEIVFNCFINSRFLQQRIQSSKVGIFSLIKDLEFSISSFMFEHQQKKILDDLCLVLKEDRHVVAGCPELLHSCLNNASEETREKVMGNKLLPFRLELTINNIALLFHPKLCDIDCCAFSHDKKLLAGRKGKYFSMFDARTFEKLFGPIEVIDSGNLLHLEFSPDDKFVFFGRLDKWFSVQERCVVKIAQFSGNTECYKWGSFIYDGSYIALIKDDSESIDHCVLKIPFRQWCIRLITAELQDRNQHELRVLFHNERLDITGFIFELREALFACNFKMCTNSSCKLCAMYRQSSSVRFLSRDQIVLFYAEMFTCQIWNAKTGRPAGEEMFCSKLEPFFYIWHLHILDIRTRFYSVESFNIDFEIGDFSQRYLGYGLFAKNVFTRVSHESIKYSSTNMPAQCLNHIYNPMYVFSQDGHWLAKEDGDVIELFEKQTEGGFSSNENRPGGDLAPIKRVFSDLKGACFTNDNSLFVFITHSPNLNLYAYSLQSGTRLQSISGLCSVSYISQNEKHVGYIFCDANKSVMISLADLPWKFLLDCSPCDSNITGDPVGPVFTSPDSQDDLVSDVQMLKLDYSRTMREKNGVFSDDGKWIAVNPGSEILLFSCDGKFVFSVFKVTKDGKLTASCLTFSSDNSLLLFRIHDSDNDQSFYVWDVNNKILSDPIHLPYQIPVDCCCFARDNSKIFFCSASTIRILPYPSKTTSCPIFFIPNVHHTFFTQHIMNQDF